MWSGGAISSHQMLPAVCAFSLERKELANHSLTTVQPATFDLKLIIPLMLVGFTKHRPANVRQFVRNPYRFRNLFPPIPRVILRGATEDASGENVVTDANKVNAIESEIRGKIERGPVQSRHDA